MQLSLSIEVRGRRSTNRFPVSVGSFGSSGRIEALQDDAGVSLELPVDRVTPGPRRHLVRADLALEVDDADPGAPEGGPNHPGLAVGVVQVVETALMLREKAGPTFRPKQWSWRPP